MGVRLPQLHRGAFVPVLSAVLALLALGLAFAQPGQGAPRMRLTGASGSLSLLNSKDVSAIFRAEGMRPGEEATGSVVITNTGAVTGTLRLEASDIQDARGLGGGNLSSALRWFVVDVTDEEAPHTVYTGTLTRMSAVPIAELAPGASRTYLFVAALPRGGSEDNAFQGAAVTNTFTWTATGSDGPVTTPTPAATPTVETPVTPAATPTVTPAAATPSTVSTDAGLAARLLGARLFPLPSTRRCLSRRSFLIHIRRPKGVVFRTLKVSINGKTKVRLKGLKARKVKARINLRGLPKGKVRVRLVAVTTTGRRAVSSRTYRTCAKPKLKRKRKRAADRVRR